MEVLLLDSLMTQGNDLVDSHKGDTDSSFSSALSFFDIESFLFVLLLATFGKTIPILINHPISWIIASLSVICMILFSGIKITESVVEYFDFERDRNYILASAPIFGIGIIYVTWMLAATFSSYAPIITLVAVIGIALAPKKIKPFRTIVKSFSGLVDSILLKEKIPTVLFIIQIGLCSIFAIVLSTVDTSRWLTTIYETVYIPIVILLLLIIVIQVYFIQTGSKYWLPSLFLLALFTRGIMLAEGFIRFGGDDGDNMVVVQWLAEGGVAPFIDLTENGWNWRYGSLATLCFHSNMAFVTTISGLSPSLCGGAIAITFSSVIYTLGVFLLSNSLLKKELDMKYVSFALVLFLSPIFWWQFRFDPNNLVQILIFPYLVCALVSPKTKEGFLIFIFLSAILLSTHFYSLAIILPAFLYFLWEITGRDDIYVILAKKEIHIMLLLISAISIIIVLNSQSIQILLDLLSLSDILGTEARIELRFGIYVMTSTLVVHFFSRYAFILPICLFGGIITIFQRSLLQDRLHESFHHLLKIWIIILFEVVILDFFVQLPTIPAWRLWPILMGICLIPIISLAFAISEINYQKTSLLKLPTRRERKTAVLLLITILTTLSLLTTTYPRNQALNLDTTTRKEYDFMYEFLMEIDLNRSVVITEFSTWRHLMAIMQDWPPTTPTYYDYDEDYPAIWSNSFGQERLQAFVELAYNDNPIDVIKLLNETHVDNVYALILTRYEGEKSTSWYDGRPYVNNIEKWGEICKTSDSGYVIKINDTLLNAVSIPLSGWSKSAMGVLQYGCDSSAERLSIWGNFTGHYQSVSAYRNFTGFNSLENGFILIRYKSQHSELAPYMKVAFHYANGSRIFVVRCLKPSREYITSKISINTTNLESLQRIQIIVDTFNEETPWNGPGIFEYSISNMYFLEL